MSTQSGAKMIDIPIELYTPDSVYAHGPYPSSPPPSAQPSTAAQHKLTLVYRSPSKATPRRESGHSPRRRKGLSGLLQADTIHVIHRGDEQMTASDFPLPVENWPQEVSVPLPEG